MGFGLGFWVLSLGFRLRVAERDAVGAEFSHTVDSKGFLYAGSIVLKYLYDERLRPALTMIGGY